VVNAGSGRARSFNEVAKALMLVHGKAEIEYVPFPEDLQGRYQHFTEADLTGLRETGCDLEFTQLEEGVQETFSQAERVLA
jgi:ADP-L-glycero-D-manno-heptose 6-epimerase